jgi:large subunit ribosomal protein L6
MRVKDYEEKLDIPEGVEVSVDGYAFTIKGPKGEQRRSLPYKGVSYSVAEGSVTIRFTRYTQKEKRMIGTFKAHLKNMFKGVTEGHVYKLKICSSHFPMNVSFQDNQLIVKNFIGEKVPRTIRISKDVDLKIDGSTIVLKSTSKELAGTTASDIEQLTRRTRFDKRIFQDGIYIIEKDGRAIS